MTDQSMSADAKRLQELERRLAELEKAAPPPAPAGAAPKDRLDALALRVESLETRLEVISERLADIASRLPEAPAASEAAPAPQRDPFFWTPQVAAKPAPEQAPAGEKPAEAPAAEAPAAEAPAKPAAGEKPAKGDDIFWKPQIPVKAAAEAPAKPAPESVPEPLAKAASEAPTEEVPASELVEQRPTPFFSKEARERVEAEKQAERSKKLGFLSEKEQPAKEKASAEPSVEERPAEEASPVREAAAQAPPAPVPSAVRGPGAPLPLPSLAGPGVEPPKKPPAVLSNDEYLRQLRMAERAKNLKTGIAAKKQVKQLTDEERAKIREERKAAESAQDAAEAAKLAKAAALAPSAPAKAAGTAEGWEYSLATKWLPRVGGLLLIIGAAYLASQTVPRLGPGAKLAMGYAFSAAIGLAGLFVRRNNDAIGKAGVGIGLALAYFSSFASHYLPATAVFPAMLALPLMAGFAGGIVALADRWRSESVAIIGCGLATVAALVSAPESQSFALVALGLVALAAGALLVRREWKRLNALALIGVYGSMLALWLTLPPAELVSAAFAHLGALACYHAIFTAAFWKWSRPWVARERAAGEAEKREAIPAMDLDAGWLPYSTSVAALNSAALIGLSLLLFWRTEIYMPQVHWLLFALAGAEGARLLVPALRRGTLWSFHWLTFFGLTSAGLAAAFSGAGESAALAAQALVLAVAASRSPALRWLRPLTLACAGLSARALLISANAPAWGQAVPLSDLAAYATPGLLLLASALPWEFLWTDRPKTFAKGSPTLWALDGLAGQLRSLMGALMVWAPLEAYFQASTNNPEMRAALILSLALPLGMCFLRARAWFGAAFLMTGALLAGRWFAAERGVTFPPAKQFVHLLWLAATLHLWSEYARAEARRSLALAARLAALDPKRPAKPLPKGTSQALLSLGALLFAVAATEPWSPLHGFALALIAGASALIALHGPKLLPCAPLALPPEEAEIEEPPAPPRMRLGWGLAALGCAASLWLAIVVDTRESLGSAAIIAGASAILWLWASREGKERPGWEALFAGLAAPTLALAILFRGGFEAPAILFASLAGLASLLGGWARGARGAAVAGAACLLPVPLLAYQDLRQWEAGRFFAFRDALAGMAACVVAMVGGRFAARSRGLLEKEGGAWDADATNLVRGWLAFAGAALALAYSWRGGLVEGTDIAVLWTILGFAALAWAHMTGDRFVMAAAGGVQALALARLFFFDLSFLPESILSGAPRIESGLALPPGMFVAAVPLLCGLFFFKRERQRGAFESSYAAGGLLAAWGTTLGAYGLLPSALFGLALLSLACLWAGFERRRRGFAEASLCFAMAAPIPLLAAPLGWFLATLNFHFNGELPEPLPGIQAVLGALAGLMLAGASPALKAWNNPGAEKKPLAGPMERGWLACSGMGVALLYLWLGGLVGGAWATAAWTAIGAALLAFSYRTDDLALRLAGFQAHAMALLKLMFFDLPLDPAAALPPGLFLGATFLVAGLYFFKRVDGSRRAFFEAFYAFGGLLAVWASPMGEFGLRGGPLFGAALLSLAAMMAGAQRGREWFAKTAALFVGGAPLMGMLALGSLEILRGVSAEGAFWSALGCLGVAAAAALGTPRALDFARDRLEPCLGEGEGEGGSSGWFGSGACWWSLGLGVFLGVWCLTGERLVPLELGTVAWGALGAALLASGLVWPHEPTRRAAYFVFGLAVVRLFQHDVAKLSKTGRAFAFFGLGLVLVGASLAYGMLTKKPGAPGKGGGAEE